MPGFHQSRGLHPRQRIAHHRATDTLGFHDVDLGRQFLAAHQHTVTHALGEAVDQGFCQASMVLLRGKRVVRHCSLSSVRYASIGCDPHTKHALSTVILSHPTRTRSPAMEQPSTSKGRRSSLTQQLVAEFSRRIREGEIQSGEKLPTEQVIIRETGVSRTVVREAMSRLQAEGLVETRHGIGTFVVDAAQPGNFQQVEPPIGTPGDAVSIIELRLSIEPESAALAAQRRTPEQLDAIRQALDELHRCARLGHDTMKADFEFHRQISLCTANSFFTDVMSQLGSSILPRTRSGFGNITSLHAEDDPGIQQREQETIFDAIVHQDRDAARAAMRLHLINSLLRLRAKD
ncbi:Transcriptional regulator, GntR family [Pseudomonas amygdali pv. eriobotryae]|uniref:GntR family transcriptional regulator n=2 Tax=Pseudomonas syringae group genomosp. 2 TaxID=251698 RepID=A0A3M5G2X1_PSESS|nr:Transcriptional regulator, GntR family [Pseudomonas amygdali pv. eriobotryae]RMS81049.1 GntR family transcriptional regulator [Pseudomonas savastanoi]